MIKTTIATLLTTCLCIPALASSTDNFSDKVDNFIKQNQLPGLVLNVKHKGQTIYKKAHGFASLKHSTPMTQNHIFRLYSMSKPITALALLQLIDKGKIALDDDIRKYLPAFKPFEYNDKAHVVTVHQLLSHTAGMGYGGGFGSWTDFRYLIANPLSRSNTLSDLVDDISGIDLYFPPGEKFQYSIASDVQGALIEAVSGQPLDKYFNENIFKPLNMKDTDFYVHQSEHNRLVDMYEYAAKTFEEAFTFNPDKIEFVEYGNNSEFLEKPTLLSGGGGLVSTSADYSNFVTMLFNQGTFQGKRLLSKSLISSMLRSHTQGLETHFLPRLYDDVGFGYSLAVQNASDETRSQGSFFWAGMGGTLFWADPEDEIEVVAMMQVEDGWIALERWLIPQVYALIDAS